MFNPEPTEDLFSKCDFIFSCCSRQMKYFCMKLVQYNEYIVSTVDADGLVLYQIFITLDWYQTKILVIVNNTGK